MYCYITENNTAGEVFEAMPPADRYHPDFIARIVEMPAETDPGCIYDWDTHSFLQPPDTPEPEPRIDDVTALQLAVAELAETQAADQTANELALAELAETMIGG